MRARCPPWCHRSPASLSVPRNLRRTLSNTLRFSSTATPRRPPDFAFAFDIDGVLLHTSTPIPGASASLQYLQKNSIPFILLTNGGGKHESARVAEITTRLALPYPITTSQFIQSHTPFADLINPSAAHPHGLKDSNVLVLGGDSDGCRSVARQYGFTSAITAGDIYTAHPEISPFTRVFKEYYSSFAAPLPKPINPTSPADSLKIDAVFVFNDPRDWALDIQILLDVLLSREGILGTVSRKNGDRSLPNNGYQQDGQPTVYFSNPDLIWAAGYHLSRLGQGGFRAAFEGVWAAVTGGSSEGVELKKVVIGKPHKETYAFAEKVLMEYRQSLLRRHPDASATVSETPSLKRVYMVGDNPESDIRGANTYKSPHGVQWISLLTRTGVYRHELGQPPSCTPREIVRNVQDAVEWALQDSGWRGARPFQ